MRQRYRTLSGFMAIFIGLGVLGVAATVYTLLHERLPLPFSNSYTVNAAFSAADGVVSGLGQPVNVVGVEVGEVTGVRLQHGHAVVTMRILRGKLPHVYADASAVLKPITPLMDMQVELDPGAPPARPLPDGATIDVSDTTTPVPLSDLESSLDGDTRDYLTTLIASLGEGTAGRGADIHKMLAALGPTVSQVGEISSALNQRRVALAGLVHNLAQVTYEASQDRQLASVVAAGDQTLHALGDQEAPLRSAIAELPSTLAVTRQTLDNVTPFADRLGPTLASLSPALGALPHALHELGSFSRVTSAALQNEVRPLVSATRPLMQSLAPAVSDLTVETPSLSGSFQSFEYLTNELAFNGGGNDQGFLFWLDWFAHNIDTWPDLGDAHGPIGRAVVFATCYGLQNITVLQSLWNVTGLCSK